MRVLRVALVLLVLGACRAPVPYVPLDSPLAAVELGMGERDVVHLLGPPDDGHRYVTPKTAIPFYVGADAVEMVFYYRRRGRVVFAAGPADPFPRVIRVEDDPAEPGFRRRR